MNHLQIMVYEGYLGKDVDFNGERNVANFTVGSTREYKAKSGEKVKVTTWLKVAAWGKLAEIVAEYCHKGSHVIVEGTLRPGDNGSPVTFQMKDGTWGASYEMTASSVRILDSKSEDFAPASHDAVDEMDIPF